jgi:hypothetical protein
MRPNTAKCRSGRWRVTHEISKENTLPSDLSVFMSNYPYKKIV